MSYEFIPISYRSLYQILFGLIIAMDVLCFCLDTSTIFVCISPTWPKIHSLHLNFVFVESGQAVQDLFLFLKFVNCRYEQTWAASNSDTLCHYGRGQPTIGQRSCTKDCWIGQSNHRIAGRGCSRNCSFFVNDL